jgi:CheY-like chemotaxis protein
VPASRTLLLVEDESHLRDAMARVLAHAGYTVLAAASGADALRLGAERPDISVIVTDIRLPDMYGRRLASRVTSERGASAPPVGVVYVSGNAQEFGDEGGLLPNERFLAKPFEFEDLLACIAQVETTRGQRLVP